MFSFLKSKITEQLQLSQQQANVTESSKISLQYQLNKTQSIMYEQVSVYIEIGQGFSEQMKKHFIDYIKDNKLPYDCNFISAVVKFMTITLEGKDREKVKRTIDIIEELVSKVGSIVNEAFNQKPFCDALSEIALYQKVMTLSYGSWGMIRKRTAGIFLFWFRKFRDDAHHYIFIQYLNKIRDNGGDIPQEPLFDQVQVVSQPKEVTQQEANSIQDIQTLIIGSQTMAAQAEQYISSNNFSKIDTQYVRALKLKNKTIYNAAVENSALLDTESKNKLNAVYKRMRNILKQIQKINEENVKERAMKKEQEFLKQRAENLKNSKHDLMPEGTTVSPIKQAKIAQKPQIKEKTFNLLGDEEINENIDITSSSPQKKQQIQSGSLLDSIEDTPQKEQSISPAKKSLDSYSSPSKSQKKIKQQDIIGSEQKKNSQEYQIDLDNYSTPKKKNKIKLVQEGSDSEYSPGNSAERYFKQEEAFGSPLNNASQEDDGCENNISSGKKLRKTESQPPELATKQQSKLPLVMNSQQSNKSDDLLGMQQKQSTQKTINFTELYRQSSPSIDNSLSDIDLTGTPTKSEKQSQGAIKVKDDDQFDEFV